MKLEAIDLPNISSFVRDYQENPNNLEAYFDYFPSTSVMDRVHFVEQQTYPREELATYIENYMAKKELSKKTRENIEALRKDALVVIGGQQAGILTGPLYSLHKAIHVIALSKSYENELNRRIVPVFWIAGEDHDFDEIRVSYGLQNGHLKRQVYVDQKLMKKMASEAEMTSEKLEAFLRLTFQSMPESVYTSELWQKVTHISSEVSSFSEFFFALMHDLFTEEGLLFVDSADPELRKIEAPFMAKLIESAPSITQKTMQLEASFNERGYGTPIQLEKDNANLFYVKDGERYLLRMDQDCFVNEQLGLSFTKEELLTVASDQPERLSNNVVTRPLMQEMLFPTIAFVGGAAEVAYWGLLKDAFHEIGLKMPIIHLRQGITYVTPRASKYLREFNLRVEDIWGGKISEMKEEMVKSQLPTETFQAIDELSEYVKQQYEVMGEKETWIEPSLLQRNLSYHNRQFTYLKQKMEDDIWKRNEPVLRKLRYLENLLYPNGGLQERVFHPYFMMNEAGYDFVQELLTLSESQSSNHAVVYL
ncbi:bacillithiol biosynthesis cysteine-adding enzyme BshC [Paenisporosarcina cavernae]|uniref:Putative cysteine ligase BshC n=1 Tax=Paenisporosarcina cavernae TaxID=2320858 RepID=A0A385YRN3_9BACL|nr:bacillithiol biosynthesis cysteine-adding enzyme BshC [Paenisporosarcina cavernae]AYC29154.1 bacillithiol biosynthesis cysteine-adding enzyme BshC [Paenisporosarcina cavernae]